ncbi:MAG: hypothetical protein IR160_12520 [Salinibacterium sp.]|nr:hypothetical protein [Salinibacterium sp.]MBF0673396.1 hypothetical protein [Salinibacterium sp.]
MPRHAFYSHVTAASLHGIPLPPRLDSQLQPLNSISLDVSVPVGMVPATGARIRSHRLRIASEDIVESRGMRFTSAERTWCDLAALLTEEELIAAGDFLVWRKRPPLLRLTPEALSLAIARFEGRRGRPALLRAAPRLSSRADSPPESTIRVRAVDAGLPEPEVNEELWTVEGEFLAQPDLRWRRWFTTFDYEGDLHRTDPRQWEKDIARVPRLENAGYRHIRGSKADLRNSTNLLGNIAMRLQDHGWMPPPRTPIRRILRSLGR